MKRQLTATAIAALAIVGSASADIYLQLPGDPYKGSVATAGYQQWIELTSVSESLFREVSIDPAVRSTGAAQSGYIEISKTLDATSPALRSALLKGSVFPTATIVVTTIGARGETIPAYKIELKNVSFAGLSASSDGETVYENLSLAYRSIQWTVEAIGPRGGMVKAGPAKWNFATDKEEF